MILRTAVLILMTMGACAASRASLLTNGGFETGDFSGWTLAGNVDLGYLEGVCANGSTFSYTPCNSNSGTYAAALGPNNLGPDKNGATLTQEVATTPGMAYTLTFFLKNDNGDPSEPVENQFGITFDNQTIQEFSNLGSFDYQEFTFTNLIASSAVTEVGFGIENTPGGFFLDDVALNAVPEPASPSLVMLALGLLVFGFRKYHTSKPTPNA